MNDEAKKLHLDKIDVYFGELKTNKDSANTLKNIENELNSIFNQDFTVRTYKSKPSESTAIMSVYPDESTIDKIVKSIVNEEGLSAVKELWNKNTHWNIEIDMRIVCSKKLDLSNRELTSLLIHEVGHTVDENSFSERLAKVVKFGFVSVSAPVKKVLQKTNLKSLVGLTILDNCAFSPSKDSNNVKKELSADHLAYKLGYREDLNSALTKCINASEISGKESTKKILAFSEDVVNQLKKRQVASAKKKLVNLRNGVGSTAIKDYVSKILKESFEATDFVTESTREHLICEQVNNIMDSYYTEFFIFGPKKLPKLDQYVLDYIQVEMQKMQSQDDKLMMLSYTYSKINMCQYYIDILSNPKYAKKYSVPHTIEYLHNYMDRLQRLRMDILKYPIPEKKYGITIQYPTGYEG